MTDSNEKKPDGGVFMGGTGGITVHGNSDRDVSVTPVYMVKAPGYAPPMIAHYMISPPIDLQPPQPLIPFVPPQPIAPVESAELKELLIVLKALIQEMTALTAALKPQEKKRAAKKRRS